MSFFELFQPGLRHLREERERQQSLVADPKSGAAGPLGIDLDSGRASFTMPAKPHDEDFEAADAQEEQG